MLLFFIFFPPIFYFSLKWGTKIKAWVILDLFLVSFSSSFLSFFRMVVAAWAVLLLPVTLYFFHFQFFSLQLSPSCFLLNSTLLVLSFLPALSN